MNEFSHPAIDAIRQAGPELGNEAARSAEERRLSDDTAEILRDTGVMRLCQPKRYGGFEADPQVFAGWRRRPPRSTRRGSSC